LLLSNNAMAVDRRAAQVARQVVRYLETHPDASDTIDGIARWWLARQRLDDAREIVRVALDLLVDRGVLYTRTLPGGVTLFEKRASRRAS
jgi:hypothetical protein